MKITGKFILVALVAVIVLSVLSAVVMPAALLFINLGEINFTHLEDSLEFVITYFVFGPPILTSGTISFLAFVILKDRLGVQKSALIAAGSFVILSVLLNILSFQVFIEGVMYFFESMGS